MIKDYYNPIAMSTATRVSSGQARAPLPTRCRGGRPAISRARTVGRLRCAPFMSPPLPLARRAIPCVDRTGRHLGLAALHTGTACRFFAGNRLFLYLRPSSLSPATHAPSWIARFVSSCTPRPAIQVVLPSPRERTERGRKHL